MKLEIIYLLITVTFFHKSYASLIPVEEKYGVVGGLQRIADNVNRDVNCTGIVGSICSDRSEDCGSVFMCFPGPSRIVVDCPEGQTCNAGKCSTSKAPLCEYKKLTFKCTTEGMYPDPSSCKKYNYCPPATSPETPINPIPFNGTCPTGWSYTAYNTRCDRKLINDNCEEADRVVPECKEKGQSDSLKPYQALYYVCSPYSKEDSTLYPFIAKCPDDKTFSGGRCW